MSLKRGSRGQAERMGSRGAGSEERGAGALYSASEMCELCRPRVKLLFPSPNNPPCSWIYFEAILLSDDSVREAAETKQK